MFAARELVLGCSCFHRVGQDSLIATVPRFAARRAKLRRAGKNRAVPVKDTRDTNSVLRSG
jgi:hypothetical protein